ncbi:hypothetical protein ACLB2K_056428 [Fragaria x ananassa]
MMMMMMEAANLEEDQSQMMIIKGKRTKRPRQSSPIVLTTTASSSSSPGGGGDDVEDHHHHHHQSGMMSTPIRVSDQDDETTASPATSAELTEMSTTEEEEDMANCLILLAQSGQTQIQKVQEQQLLLLQQQQPIKAVAAADTAPGLYVYECKTCNRCFSSFQALGGHRASHKKPKVISNVTNTTQTQPKKALSFMEDQDEYDRRFNNNTTSTTLSLQVSNRVFVNSKGTKVHECSVCGAEFASGQALGGHMRRHRTFINTTTTAPAAPTMSSPQSHQASNKRPRSVLELDLNLPAPEEERLDITKLPFSSSKKEQVIVFSASPLVGCHY